MAKKKQIVVYFLMVLVCLSMESCAGCAHRYQKRRERLESRNHARNERKSDKGHNSDDATQENKIWMLSSEAICQIANGEDYDKMIDCLFNQLEEIKAVKKEYFKGDLPDKEAKIQMSEIANKYNPIHQTLQKASEEGALNYNQHKRQMKLWGEYVDELNSVAAKLGMDMDGMIDM